MSWVSIRQGDMLGMLSRLHGETVYNGTVNIAQRQDLTVANLRELLEIIENEECLLMQLTPATCTYEPSEYGDGQLWYTCSECGGHVSADYDAPSYCPHCGCKIERGDSDEAGE